MCLGTMHVSCVDLPGIANLDIEIPRAELGSNVPRANPLNVAAPNIIALVLTKIVAFAFIFRVIEYVLLVMETFASNFKISLSDRFRCVVERFRVLFDHGAVGSSLGLASVC